MGIELLDHLILASSGNYSFKTSGCALMDARTFTELHDECRDRVLFGIRGYVRNHDEAEDVTASVL